MLCTCYLQARQCNCMLCTCNPQARQCSGMQCTCSVQARQCSCMQCTCYVQARQCIGMQCTCSVQAMQCSGMQCTCYVQALQCSGMQCTFLLPTFVFRASRWAMLNGIPKYCPKVQSGLTLATCILENIAHSTCETPQSTPCDVGEDKPWSPMSFPSMNVFRDFFANAMWQQY